MRFKPAVRENLPLLIGLAGGTGSGKTLSAMLLAKGLSGGQRFAVIDTENGRAKHYADMFDFDVADLQPPFRPDAYTEAVKTADAAGYPVIIVDSMSHEHAGDGGLLDWQEEELDRLAGDDWKKRDRVKFTAWIKPKAAHKKMVTALLQTKAHVILCFRAEQKIEMVKNAQGKLEVIPKQSAVGLDGWIPISEKNLPYEATVSFLVVADKPGIPMPIKLQAQHRPFFPLDKPISEEAGRLLAEWASGGENKRGGAAEAAGTAESSEGAATTSAGDDSAAPPDSNFAFRENALFRLTDELGVTEARHSAKKARANKTDAEYGKWLDRQIKTAGKNLEAKRAGGEGDGVTNLEANR